MHKILPTGNVKVTNVNGPHGKDDPANLPPAMHQHVTPGEKDNPQNMNFLTWRKPGSAGNG